MLPGRGFCKKSLLVILFVFGLEALAAAQQSQLGKVDFPNSGSPQAQPHFLRGLAALHSFWYEEALEAFREATRVDPNFALGYWGEALAHNHPLWSEQNTDAARKALEKIKDTKSLTPREQAYINAARALYGEGDKLARDHAYAAAMEKLYRDYPDDLEAASFYSLSLLGTVRPGDKGYRRQALAGAIAMEVFQKNPNHPGAAHYIIHSFDDPEHAIIALPAARRYAEIAPEAHHARHMPSHIFIQLGMWADAASSNESSWAASDTWVKRKNLSIAQKDYHSLTWLLYIYLQQGRYSKADELFSTLRQSMKESPVRRIQSTYVDMATAYIVETERWDEADKLLNAPELKSGAQRAEQGAVMGQHCSHGASAKPQDGKTAQPPPAAYGREGRSARPAFALGMAAGAKGKLADVEKYITELAMIRKQRSERGEIYSAKQVEIMELGVTAFATATQGHVEQAITLMKKATALEESLDAPSGPPDVLKPSHELFGEILLRAGRPKEAAEQFRIALLRQPNRARSLLGAARAARESGDQTTAAAGYANLARVWQKADPQLPALKEVQDQSAKLSPR